MGRFGSGGRGVGLARRRLLQVTGGGAVALASAAAGWPRSAGAVSGRVRWLSPRGSVEVLDDYAYWVAKKFGYFGEIETTLEPGPMQEIVPLELVAQGQAEVGFPPPRVFALALERELPLVSVWQMGAYDVFDLAFRQGGRPADLKALAGKTILLGSAGWQAIVAPLLKQAGVDPASVSYAEAGNGWGQALKEGQGDAALSWEGLRAQWQGQGLEFDYILGREFSKFPANSFVIRRGDFADPGKDPLYEGYLRGWAMGLEFGHLNPRAATHLVLEQFPALAETLTPAVATTSLMQLANVFRGDWESRRGWGWHDLAQWRRFFATIRELGQISRPIAPPAVISNKYVPAANRFDRQKVATDASSYQLPPEFETVDVEAIATRL